MAKPNLHAVGFSGFTADTHEQAQNVVGALLDLYEGKSLEGMTVLATRLTRESEGVVGFQAVTLYLRGKWQLSFFRSGGSYDWTLEQRCPQCNGGSRWEAAWDKQAQENRPVLACGGCGFTLAPPGMGIHEYVRLAPSSFFPRRELESLLESLGGFDPFTAVMEADALVTFFKQFAYAGADLPRWSSGENLPLVRAGKIQPQI